jgi:glucosamine-6-phosphate deaminase
MLIANMYGDLIWMNGVIRKVILCLLQNQVPSQNAMENAFYGPLGELTVPKNQRFFATKELLPKYPEKINSLRKKGAKLIVIFGIGRVFHIAFWEPHFAEEFKSEEEWKKQEYRLGAKLHPLTIEQNAITSFKSRTTLVPCFANTIGPGIFLKADKNYWRCRWNSWKRNDVAGYEFMGYIEIWT